MKHNPQIVKQVEAALNALDGAERAKPKPFLLTRINARLHAKQESIWDKALYFISRPAIAIVVVCLVIVVNIFAVSNGNMANDTLLDEVQNTNVSDEDVMASNTLIIDNENIEP